MAFSQIQTDDQLHQLHPTPTLRRPPKTNMSPLITLICARACNTHLRWGFLVPTYCLQWILAMTWVGAFFFSHNALNHYFGNGTAARFTSGIEKHFLTRTHQTFSFCQNCWGINVPTITWHIWLFQANGTVPITWHELQGHTVLSAECFGFLAMISSKSCKVFNIFLKTRYHIIIKTYKICILFV